jgi:hypothetical protein
MAGSLEGQIKPTTYSIKPGFGGFCRNPPDAMRSEKMRQGRSAGRKSAATEAESGDKEKTPPWWGGETSSITKS